jgi:hypothetical protein
VPLAVGPVLAEAPYNHTGLTFHPYSMEIASSAFGTVGDDLAFGLTAANGTPVEFAFVGLIGSNGCWIGTYTASWSTGLPSAPPPGSATCSSPPEVTLTSQIVAGETLVLVTEISISGHGYTLAIVSSGTSAGTTTAFIE